jgi:ParB-like chromosome segregation protein Spo0J
MKEALPVSRWLRAAMETGPKEITVIITAHEEQTEDEVNAIRS